MTPKEAIERCLSEHRGMITCEETCWCWEMSALLEQAEPPAGKFTKKVRGSWAMNACSVGWLHSKLIEACDRLDAQQLEYEKLTLDNDSLRLELNIVKAENAKLREALESIETAKKSL